MTTKINLRGSYVPAVFFSAVLLGPWFACTMTQISKCDWCTWLSCCFCLLHLVLLSLLVQRRHTRVCWSPLSNDTTEQNWPKLTARRSICLLF